MNLFQQIAETQANLLSTISAEDLEVLNQSFKAIEDARDDVITFQDYHNAMDFLPVFKTLKKPHIGKSSWLNDVEIEAKELERREVYKLITHFNQTYKLNVSLDKDKKEEAGVNREEFLRVYYREGGITNLTRAGEERLINRFYDKCTQWRNRTVHLKGKSVKIDSYYRLDEFDLKWDNTKWNIHYNYREEMRTLREALLFYENGTIGLESNNMNLCVPEDTIKERTIWFGIYDKLDKIQYFKNGNIKITFNSNSDANDFYTLFKFDQYKPQND